MPEEMEERLQILGLFSTIETACRMLREKMVVGS